MSQSLAPFQSASVAISKFTRNEMAQRTVSMNVVVIALFIRPIRREVKSLVEQLVA